MKNAYDALEGHNLTVNFLLFFKHTFYILNVVVKLKKKKRKYTSVYLVFVKIAKLQSSG